MPVEQRHRRKKDCMEKDNTKSNRRQWDGNKAPKQAGETHLDKSGAGPDLTKTPRLSSSCAKSGVWTPRMLAALVNGVKGGRWFALIDKVYQPANLAAAFEAVKSNKGAAGTDHQTVGMFDAKREENLATLNRELKEGTYRPRPVKRVWIPKPASTEKRPLGIPAVRDRVVQSALRNAIEPIFERRFAEHSYGFRPHRGCKDALRRVDQLLKEGYTWVVDADLKSYFDTIDHDRLMQMVEEEIADRRVLSLVRQFLNQGVLDEMKYWEPDAGTPQGGVISPLLSNIYLTPLDHLMAREGFEMVRYADDFVIVCQSQTQAQQALARVRQWVEQARLELHPQKTQIVDATQRGGFDFLGYHFERGCKWPRTKSMRKLKDSIRRKTKRCSGNSMERIISRVNPILRGWYEYFKHSHRNTMTNVDKWVRGRLRSILRKRSGRKGRARGDDHHRWKNAFFTELGLVSLAAAFALDRQSASR